MLTRRADSTAVHADEPPATREEEPPAPPASRGRSRRTQETAPERGVLSDFLWGTGRRQGAVEAAAKQAARSIGGQLGRRIVRGILGGIAGSGR